MKKLLILAILLLPNFAQANTDLVCGSYSMSGPGPLTISIQSPSSILNNDARVTIVAQGILTSQFELVAEPAFSSYVEKNVRLRQVDPETGDLIEPGIEALLSLDVTQRFEGENVFIDLSGTGSIRLIQAPNRGLPMLQPLYSLSDCTGQI